MVSSEVVYLFLEYSAPEVFTNKLHDVQIILKSWTLLSESEYK